MSSFEKFNLSSPLLTGIKRLGFENPTQIQEESIPLIMSGKDVIGESATGSGKTLAFGCGIIEHVIPKKGIQALVLTPTRELAEQVKEAIKQVALHKKLNFVSVYGGVSMSNQIHDLVNAEVVVATPGRLLDHLNRRTIDISKVKILVLDEADRMLDMGFIDDVEEIMRSCPKERQTLFFSATISSRIKALSRKYMTSPKEIHAERMVDPKKLQQTYYDIQKNMKLSLLVHLLKKDPELVMIFCNTRRTTDFVVDNLKANKIKAIAIHGGMTQNKRSKTIEVFNEGKIRILVCTDVAARGIHIDNVSHVYNYEIPKDPNDYVHRIGRTARAGESGEVVNFLCDMDYGNFGRVQSTHRDYKIKKADTPPLERVQTVKSDSGSRGRGGFGGGSRFGSQGGRGGSRGPRFGGRGGSRGPRSGSQGGSSSGRRFDSSESRSGSSSGGRFGSRSGGSSGGARGGSGFGSRSSGNSSSRATGSRPNRSSRY